MSAGDLAVGQGGGVGRPAPSAGRLPRCPAAMPTAPETWRSGKGAGSGDPRPALRAGSGDPRPALRAGSGDPRPAPGGCRVAPRRCLFPTERSPGLICGRPPSRYDRTRATSKLARGLICRRHSRQGMIPVRDAVTVADRRGVSSFPRAVPTAHCLLPQDNCRIQQ
jgi:hypothetical protein